MTRRSMLFRLLAFLGCLLVAAALLRWRMVKQLLSAPRGAAMPPASPATAARERARVVMVAGGTPQQQVEQALARIGAAALLAVKGKTVLVKPNIVSGSPAPTTTSPAVVHAVCDWLRRQGAKTVWVGDMAAVMTLGTRYAMRESGIEAAVRAAGATPVYFEEGGWVKTSLAGARYLREVPVSDFVTRADLVINLPVIKSHRWATYSVCLKNFVGATHGRYRPYMIDRDHWEEIIAELNLAYRPALNLVDGTRVMYSGGPWRGDEAPLGLVLAGTDGVACDAVAVALMKTFSSAHQGIQHRGVWEQPQLQHARAIGLSAAGPGALDLDVEHLEPAAALEARLAEVRRLLA